jgi:hypothetical protein
MILKKIPLLIILCIASSILIILFYLFSFNFFATPPKTSKELLEEHLKTDNIYKHILLLIFSKLSRLK